MNLRFLCSLGLASFITLSAGQSFANPEFLPPDQAFQFSAESLNPQSAQLKWKIAPHYYLYHDQFKVTVNQQTLKLDLPAGKEKNDPTFGVTDVHYNQVAFKIAVQPNSKYQVLWQGCSDEGLCYPLQRRTISTDAEGLLPQSTATAKKNAFASSTAALATTLTSNSAAVTPAPDAVKGQLKTEATTQSNAKLDQNIAKNADTSATSTTSTTSTAVATSDLLSTTTLTSEAALSSEVETQQTTSAAQTAATSADSNPDSSRSNLQLNNDQGFFQLLSPDTLLLNLLVFFLLGILLAFLPCSLPLIPILSGIIVQRASGYKAMVIALCFVVSMALVYSLMGVVVAEIGYSFQRWFQSPWLIGLFALIFVALALNLFGLYQLTMPQGLMHVLDKFQNKQKGGTLVGAIIMGALSALIVGPCMSAPLAGALLFVSQSHDPVLGGIYLFILGLGIGLPLFIASVFGAKYLPKPGLWMDRIKVGFGFVMLMVAVYFIRPMIPSLLYFALLALLFIVLAFYLVRIRRESSHKLAKISLILLAALSFSIGLWNVQNSFHAYQVQNTSTELLTWHKVTTADELEQALAAAKAQQRPILIDVYADWCVACQPIEKEVLPRADVQAAMADYTLIKLDLTVYNETQDLILKQREILGPPTLLFLDANAQEQRGLRLTGTFTAAQFIQQLHKVSP